MNMTPVKSNNIEAIGYDVAKMQLNVTFKDGKTFGYTIVSLVEYKALISSVSIDKSFASYIRAHKKSFEVLDIDEAEEVGEVAELKAQVELFKKHLLMIERISLSYPPDREILAVAQEALSTIKDEEVD